MKKNCVFLATILCFSLSFLVTTTKAGEVTPQEAEAIIKELKETGGAIQPIGQSNDAYAKYFNGKSYLADLSTDKNLHVHNVTFAHGARNFWHIHHNSCQVLIAESGHGYYQIWGEEPQEILPGQTVTIPPNTKHWHGAAPNTSFQHIALMVQGKDVRTEWLEPVDEKIVQTLKSGAVKHPAQKIVQTAGREQLGQFAPDFAHYNDDILFGEVWSRNDKLSLHDRSIVTVSALVASGILDNSLKFHIMSAKKNGVTQEEIVEIITQLGFYAGWPKAWAAFNLAKEIYATEQ